MIVAVVSLSAVVVVLLLVYVATLRVLAREQEQLIHALLARTPGEYAQLEKVAKSEPKPAERSEPKPRPIGL